LLPDIGIVAIVAWGVSQMTTARWVLLVLIVCVIFASPQIRAEGPGSGWVDATIGYSPEDVRRFLRYRRIRQERLERQGWYNGDEYYHRPHYHHRHHHHAHYQHSVCVTDFWGNCVRVARHRHAYRWRYLHRRHRWHRHEHRDGYRHAHWHPSRERIDHGLVCHARRRVVGEERPSRAKAQRAADNAWMGSVRYDHGERYQDLNHAKDVRHNCDPSSTTTILKRVFFRCVIEATPCRAPVGASGERVERRYEEETDEDDK
jgi:hypothetical protein